MRTSIAAVLVAAGLLLTAGQASAAADKCTVKKMKALAKAEKGALTCYGKEQADAAFDEAACLATNLSKLESKLLKIGSGCAGDYASCQPRVSSCTPAITAAGPSGATKCEGKKRKAAAKYAGALLKCRGGDTVTECSSTAASKFATAISKADADVACAGTEAGLGAAVVSHCVDKIAPPGDPIPLCTGCVEATDCATNDFCSTGVCADDTCTAGERSCSGTNLQQCAPDGSASSSVATCDGGCVEGAPGSAWCGCADDWDCPAGDECVVDQCAEGPGTCPAAADWMDILPIAEITWGGLSQTSPDATASVFPLSSQVVTAPIVANLDDDNEDGSIDELDFPEILFISYCGSDLALNGIVRAIHGGGPDKGADYFATCGATTWHEGDSIGLSCACSSATANSSAILAVGDLDGDGVPEIVVADENDGLTILDNTGVPIAQSAANQWPSSYVDPAPALANLDGAGFAEIVVGSRVFTLGHDVGGNLEFVDRFSGSLMDGMNGQGPTVCVADISGDSRPEIVAGTTVYAMPAPPVGVTRRSECAVGAMDAFCLGQLSVVWDGQTVNGAVAIPAAQRDGFCAVADVLGADETIAPGPANPLDGTAEVVLIAEGRLFVLNGQTGTLRRNLNLGLGADGGAPVVADTDDDGFPEIGSAFGNRYALLDLQDPSAACPAWPTAFSDAIPFEDTPVGLQGNSSRAPGGACTVDIDCAAGAVCRTGSCVCLHNNWLRVVEDDSSRVTSSVAFDFNGDGTNEIAYQDECYLRLYEGRTGQPRFKDNNPSRTRIEHPTVADIDGDGSAEIAVVSNNEASTCSSGANYANGVKVWGEAEGDWQPTRRIWNQHSYHVTNVTEAGAIPADEVEGWIPSNGRTYQPFRSNPRHCTIP